MPTERNRLVMIGIDTADIDYITDHLDYLPNLRAAFSETQPIELCSAFDLFPGSVWPSFFTSREPGDHRFYNITAWDAAVMRLRRVTPESLPLRPFWRNLAERGVRVITLDVPMTYPPRYAA